MYQRIAIEAAAMYAPGVLVRAIAKQFGLDHHTADNFSGSAAIAACASTAAAGPI